MPTEGIYFKVLGRLEASTQGTKIMLPGSQVLQGLLGVLLLARGEPLPTYRLVRLVWADRAESTRPESVHVGMSRLRKWLRRANGAGGLVIGYEDGYLLRGAAHVDLAEFFDRADSVRSLTEPQARREMLASALELHHGPILAGLDTLDRTDLLVRTVEGQVRGAVLDLAGAASDAGVPDVALGAVGGLAEEFPFDEPLHAALVDLLAESGRTAEALRAYQRLSVRLGEELGVEPGEQVKQSYLRVLAADRPHPGEDAKAPAPSVPAQLPPDIADFIGRTTEVALLVKRLAGAQSVRSQALPVATVAGMGGYGKTTLAVHVAHRLAAAFSDGQLYVDLHGVSDDPAAPEDVLDRFLRALGINGSGIPSSLEERTALYRSRLAGRRILVVLDNAAGEDQVRPLLPGTPQSAVLITGRHRLIGLEGALLLDLDVLPSAEAVGLLIGVVGEQRVMAEPGSAMDIARLCGHVPLAVRIAAVRLLGRPHWTLARLAGVLGENRRRLDELVAGDLEVRTSFEMSYRPLPEATRRAFRMLGSLEAPDFASWVVAALLDVPLAEGRRHLESLIDAHLVSAVGTDQTGRLRYRMHDFIRLYARERAEEDDLGPARVAALRRAIGAWLWLAEQASDQVPGPCYAAMHGTATRWPLPPGDTARLLEDPMGWFAAERAALFAEVRQACELRLDETAWDLAASVERYCDVRGLYEDWRQMHERALRLCQERHNTRGEAVLLRGLIEVAAWIPPTRSGSTMVAMRSSADRLLRLFTELGDRQGMADAMVAIVWGLTAQGAKAEALALAERALELSTATGYLGGQARACHVMAVAHGEQHADRALTCLERALEFAEALGNPRFLATVLLSLGAARALCGDPDGGRKLLEDSLSMARDLDDRCLEAFSLLYLAKLYTVTGDDRARPTVELVLARSQIGHFKHHLAAALAVLGELNLDSGDLPTAIACLERSVRAWRAHGWLPHLAGALRTLGDAYSVAGDPSAAQARWTEARELFVQTGDDLGRDSVQERLEAENVAG